MVFRVASGGGGLALQTNGVANSSQTLLNLAQGGGMSITELAGTVTFVAGAVPSDIIASDAPNTDFDLTNGGAGGNVTVINKSITGISAKDQIELDVWFTILNNSGNARNYTATGDLGSLVVGGTVAAGGLAANATNRCPGRCTFKYSVSASNLAFGQLASVIGSAAIAANGSANIGSVFPQSWDSTTSDLTGTQTIDFKVASNNTTATQTLTLHSYTIRKISTNP